MEVTELVDKCDTSSEDVQLARQIVVKAKANNDRFFFILNELKFLTKVYKKSEKCNLAVVFFLFGGYFCGFLLDCIDYVADAVLGCP